MFRRLVCLASLALVLLVAGNARAILVGHWKLDGNAADSSISGLDGEITGSPNWVDGKVGVAMEIDGDDWIEIPGTSATDGYPGLSGEVTWAVWFKTSNSGVINSVMTLGPAGAAHVQGNRSINVEAAGDIMIRAHSVGALTTPRSAATVADGEWHHVAVTIAFESDGDNDTMKVYIDGDLSQGYETTDININQHSGPGADFIVTLGARGSTPFVGLIDDVRVYDHVLTEDEILAAMAGGGGGFPLALLPNPEDGAMLEATWANLSWRAGSFAVSHDLYFGTSFDDVNDGAEGTFVGDLTTTTQVIGFPGFPASEGLQPGTTYYWRVDEVNDANAASPWKGDIWSLSVAPRTAYAPDPADGAESVALDAELSWAAGFEAKLHTVYFGDNFEDVNSVTGGTPTGDTTFTPLGPLELAKTYYWRVDEFDPPTTYKGTVWSLRTEGTAANPIPVKGAVDISPTPILKWTPGSLAASHEVYFGADADVVLNAGKASSEYKGTAELGQETYDAGRLELETTYYWRIDEVNSTNPGSPWIGNVWSFTTGDFLVVDDFESYNDIDPPHPNSNRIFDKWIDGFGTTTNGALVGNDLPPYAEQTTVHGGAQSMPYFYDNANKTSEATLTLVYPRDWTEEGVTKLSLWFRGASGNAAERMFVALNGTAVVYHADPAASQITGWNEWVIDLAAFGVDLTNVSTITIGFGTKDSPTAGGTGTMYFDDIRLVR